MPTACRSLPAVVCALAPLAAGCQFPTDPEGTLERVEGGTMRVGVIHDPPWVVLEEGREPEAVEPRSTTRSGSCSAWAQYW